jgi:SAM-dependent methyltransferase
MHLNSELLFRKYLQSFFKENYKILEIGPSGFPSAYEKIVDNSSIEWHTIDFGNTKYIDSAINNLTYKLIDPYNFPVEDEMYDIVLSGQVIEHVEKIWVWLREIKRVLKKGGLVITINPVSWPYHEAPIDCWRIFPNGINAIADEVGLSVELSLFESLEAKQILYKDRNSKLIPGQSYNYETPKKRINNIILWNKIIRKIPKLGKLLQIPIEIAYDTISVLKK